jgi:adenine specific DNA methylase Mod
MIKDIVESNRNEDISALKTKQLKEIFPGAFHGDTVDVEYIKNQLKYVKTTREGYELNFLGKSYAKLLTSLETETVITPDIDHNSMKSNKNSENIYISSDNLDALKHLLKSYWRKAKIIYIDPPYNTGSDGFVYSDSFHFSSQHLIEKLGLSEEEAERVIEMTSTSNSSHSAWLTFMYPRLYLAKDLLDMDGFIFISIDDNEVSNLKLLMDDIYGENNFVAMLSVENNPKGRKNSKYISVSNDYCLVYARNKEEDSSYFVENIPKNINDLTEDEDGNFVHNSGKRVLVGENNFNKNVEDLISPKHYTVYYHPDIREIVIKKEEDLSSIDLGLLDKGYDRYISYFGDSFVENTYTEDKFIELFDSGRLEFKNSKIYEKNMSTTIRMKSILSNREYIGVINGIEANVKLDYKTTSAGTYLKNLFDGKKVFSNPKPVGLIKSLLTLIDDKNALVVDFFSGSATTGDAVMQLNQEDGGNRKYILVQLPENLDDLLSNATLAEAKYTIQNAIDVCDETKKPHTLDYVGMERINRVINQFKVSSDLFSNNFEIGYKHFTIKTIEDNTIKMLDSFNPSILFTDRGILDQFGIDTVLTTWKNLDGYGLTKEWTELKLREYVTYKIEGTIYLLNPDISNDAIKAFLEKYEDDSFYCNKIVIFGYSFTMSEIQSIKDNLKQVEGIRHITLDIIVRY